MSKQRSTLRRSRDAIAEASHDLRSASPHDVQELTDATIALADAVNQLAADVDAVLDALDRKER